jgi:transposase-like protein
MDEKNRVVSRAIYNVLGIDKDGHKDLLGMYVSKSECANFWLSVLTDLQNRGVKDIMIACKKWTMPVPNWGIISQQLAI